MLVYVSVIYRIEIREYAVLQEGYDVSHVIRIVAVEVGASRIVNGIQIREQLVLQEQDHVLYVDGTVIRDVPWDQRILRLFGLYKSFGAVIVSQVPYVFSREGPAEYDQLVHDSRELYGIFPGSVLTEDYASDTIEGISGKVQRICNQRTEVDGDSDGRIGSVHDEDHRHPAVQKIVGQTDTVHVHSAAAVAQVELHVIAPV